MPDLAPRIDSLRAFAAEHWSPQTHQHRCRAVAAARHAIASSHADWPELSQSEQRTDPVDTVAAEVLPLCDALQWLGKAGPRVLASRKAGARGRPLWLWGVRSRVDRVAHGVVLIIGTWNYPMLLGGIQAAQALAAGNGVLWKPAPGSEPVCRALATALHSAGVPEAALQVLDSDVSAATEAIDAGVDLVVLTGSAGTGRKVLAQTAQRLTPTILELSGCDAAVVLAGADLDLAVNALRFGLTINSGATCIGPRRLIVEQPIAAEMLSRLRQACQSCGDFVVHPAAREAVAAMIQQTLDRGAQPQVGRVDLERLRGDGRMTPLVLGEIQPDWPIASADLFAPIATWQQAADPADAVDRVNASHYGLAATVFAERARAAPVAGQLRVGNVTINDMIIPTADPRLPFGGCGESGFGTTRGPEGLLQMTRPRVESWRTNRWLPHLQPTDEGTLPTLQGLLQLRHSGHIAGKRSGLRQILRGARASRAASKSP